MTYDETNTSKILVVEDDPKIAEMLGSLLKKHGYEVTCVFDGESAVDLILETLPDLVVLDIMLPGINGVEVCKRIRDHFQGSVMMLTALDDDIDQLLGLEVGADDYLVKSTASRLIVARIGSLLRRQRRVLQQSEDRIELNWLRINVSNREVWLYDSLLELTTGEYDLLHYFAKRAGRQVTRLEVAQDVFGLAEYDHLDRSVDISVARLRKRLNASGADGSRLLKSVRGIGYLLVQHDEVGLE